MPNRAAPQGKIHSVEWGNYDLRTGERNLDVPAENRHLALVLAAPAVSPSRRVDRVDVSRFQSSDSNSHLIRSQFNFCRSSLDRLRT